MMKGLVMDDNMSNLTSTSGEVSASVYSQQSFASTNQAPSSKKKRNLPGNPDPGAEVIALSPKTLMATNRFVCEICNKGFQRDQNLQLHRRGHNLPWKLKQRVNNEVIRKKVYVCPEPTCVYHDPARALGDLTGIKKHFSRKHGEKKWKCEKCSKRYAVQSDWKAHSRICGTREYRCDCGTLFCRRDSFITHRAFCDALAEESARTISATNSNTFFSNSHQIMSNEELQPHLHGHGLSVKQDQDHLMSSARAPTNIDNIYMNLSSSSSSSTLLADNNNNNNSSNNNLSRNQNPYSPFAFPPFQNPTSSPHMSATALLQKAAQMGVTLIKPVQSPPAAMQMPHHQHQGAHMSGSSSLISSSTSLSSLAASKAGLGSVPGLSPREEFFGSGFPHGLASYGNKAANTDSCFMEQVTATNSTNPSLLHNMMINSLSSENRFDSFHGILKTKLLPNTWDFHQTGHITKEAEFHISRYTEKGSCVSSNIAGGRNDGLTRDFLGLKALPHGHFSNLGLAPMNPSSADYGQQNQHNQTTWQG